VWLNYFNDKIFVLMFDALIYSILYINLFNEFYINTDKVFKITISFTIYINISLTIRLYKL